MESIGNVLVDLWVAALWVAAKVIAFFGIGNIDSFDVQNVVAVIVIVTGLYTAAEIGKQIGRPLGDLLRQTLRGIENRFQGHHRREGLVGDHRREQLVGDLWSSIISRSFRDAKNAVGQLIAHGVLGSDTADELAAFGPESPSDIRDHQLSPDAVEYLKGIAPNLSEAQASRIGRFFREHRTWPFPNFFRGLRRH